MNVAYRVDRKRDVRALHQLHFRISYRLDHVRRFSVARCDDGYSLVAVHLTNGTDHKFLVPETAITQALMVDFMESAATWSGIHNAAYERQETRESVIYWGMILSGMLSILILWLWFWSHR